MFGLDIILGIVGPIAVAAISDAINQRIKKGQMLKVLDKSSPANAHFVHTALELGYEGLGKHLKKKLK